MWTRAELKEKAKFTFKRNYWRVVLISVIFAMISGGFSSGSSYRNASKTTQETIFDSEESWDEEDSFGSIFHQGLGTASVAIGKAIAAGIIFVVVFLVVFFIVMVIVFAINILVVNPLEVGSKRFFLQNLNQMANVREITFAYDNDFKNVAVVMFCRDLYEFLWTLLFIIPGIVKSYEYRMIPYLLAEHPDMPKDVAFAESKRMMDGQKWDAFILDLSFIGWDILSGITFGLLGIFYVNPYKYMTNAALYEALRYGTPQNSYGQSSYSNPYSNPYEQNPYGQN